MRQRFVALSASRRVWCCRVEKHASEVRVMRNGVREMQRAVNNSREEDAYGTQEMCMAVECGMNIAREGCTIIRGLCS